MELLFVHTYHAFLHCVAGINNYDREDANSSPLLIEKNGYQLVFERKAYQIPTYL